MEILFVLNEAPYGSEKTYNALRLAMAWHGRKIRLDLGGVSIKLDSYGAAHTPASLVVSIPADKIVYAGDILYSGRLLAVIPDSNINSWIMVFDQLKQYGVVAEGYCQ